MTNTAEAASATTFDPTVALGGLLADVGLSVADAGGQVTFAGQDPMIAARHRLGAAIGIPMMGNAIAAAAMHRLRGGPGQDLHLDLRHAIHHINPSFAWKPTLAGEFPSIALVLDNPFAPFALIPYRTRDGRTVMASSLQCLAIGMLSNLKKPPMRRACRRAWPEAPKSGWPTRTAHCWPVSLSSA